MPNAQTLTVAELKSLLLANLKKNQPLQTRLEARMAQALGNKAPEKNSEEMAVLNKFADSVADLLAHRLERNQHTTPLLSYDDLELLVPSLLNDLTQEKDVKPTDKDHKNFLALMKPGLKYVVDLVYYTVPAGMNAYEAYWNWLNTLLNLATERGVLPAELLMREEANDEIARRLYSKEQFIALLNKAMNKFMDFEVVKAASIQHAINLLAMDEDVDDEDRRCLKQGLEANTEVASMIRGVFEKTKVIVIAFINEETARIYGAA